MRPCKVCKVRNTCTMQENEARRHACFTTDSFEFDESAFLPINTDDVTGRPTLKMNESTVSWVETPNGDYQFMNGELVKVPGPKTDF